MDPITAKFIADLLMGLGTSGVFELVKQCLSGAGSASVIDSAALKTAQSFSSYPDLQDTLKRWAALKEVKSLIEGFSRGNIENPGDSIKETLLKAGFHINVEADETAACQIILIFFDALKEEILRSEQANQYMHSVAVRERNEILKTVQNTDVTVKHLEQQLEDLKAPTGFVGSQLAPIDSDIPKEFVVVRTLLEKGHPRKATAALETIPRPDQAEDSHRWSYFSETFRGWIAIHEHRGEAAVSAFRNALTYWPERGAAHRNLGLALLIVGDIEGARIESENALRIEPESEDSLILKVQITAGSKGYEEAIRILEENSISESAKGRIKGRLLHNARRWSESLLSLDTSNAKPLEKQEILQMICSATGALLSEAIEQRELPPWVVTWEKRELLVRAVGAADEAKLLLRDTELDRERATACAYAASFKSLIGQDEAAKHDLQECLEIGDIRSVPTLCLLAQSEMRVGMFSDAEKHAKTILETTGNSDEGAVSLAESILRVCNSRTTESDLSTETAEQSSGSSSTWQKGLQDAEELISEGEWAKACRCLKDIVTPFAPRFLIRRFLAAAHNSGDYQLALTFITQCKDSGRIDLELYDVEASIWENLRDLDRALKAVDAAEAVLGTSIHWKVRRSSLLLRSGDREAAATSLPSVDECGSVELGDLPYAVGLSAELGRHADALLIAYRGVLNYFDKADAHQAYIGLFLSAGKELSHLLESAFSKQGSVVGYTSDGSRVTIVLLDVENHPADIETVKPGSERFRKLVNRSEGDEVELKTDSYGSLSVRIKMVVDKHVWTFRDCMDRFEERFPSETSLRKVKVEGDPGEMLEKLVPEEDKRIEKWREMYERGILPVSTLGRIRGTTDHEAYGALVSGQLGVFRAWDGNPDALQADIALLNSSPAVCLEATSGMVLAELGALDQLKAVCSRICACGLSVEDVERSLADERVYSEDGHLYAVRVEGKATLVKATREEVQSRIEFFEAYLKWLRTNVDILPIPVEIPDKLNGIEHILTRGTFGTLSLCLDSGLLLLAEDWNLRRIVRDILSLSSSWSLPVILAAHDAGFSQVDIDDVLVRLAASNYRFLPITGGTLARAYAQDNGITGPRTVGVLACVSERAMQSLGAAHVVAGALRTVWTGISDEFHRIMFLDACLEAFGARGNWSRERGVLLTVIGHYFRLLPIEHRAVLGHITTWESRRVL